MVFIVVQPLSRVLLCYGMDCSLLGDVEPINFTIKPFTQMDCI